MLNLPEYPWEQLVPYRQLAAEHPEGVADLSIGTPVDDTAQMIQQALSQAANAHGYPTADGTEQLRQAIVDWYARRRGVTDLTTRSVIPSVGSKEFIAWLPLFLGIGPGDVVVRPSIAYPTYDISAQLVGATPVAADNLDELDAQTRSKVKLVWTNSPSNPTGRVDEVSHLRTLREQARELSAVIAADECYAELGWGRWETEAVPSILDPRVCDGDYTGLISVYSLSKQSNLAGYRAAFAAGDEHIITGLVNSRKHAGMMVPGPIQAAMIVALGDEEHVKEQKDRYRNRRSKLQQGLEAAGLVIDDSEAGLYLWARSVDTVPSPGTVEQTWDLVDRMARAGIVVGPGVFYGEGGHGYIRVAITATDHAVDQAVRRLTAGV